MKVTGRSWTRALGITLSCWWLWSGCPSSSEPDAALRDAPSIDAPDRDVGELDASGPDAPGPDAALDGPRLDAFLETADAPAPPTDGWASDAPGSAGLHILALSVGLYETCVIDRVHRLWCWGRDQTPTRVSDWDDVTVVDVGNNARCAVRATGLYCWEGSSSPTRVMLPLPPPVTDVAVGGGFTCALAADGVHCWGSGLGALGSDGTVPVPELADTVSIEADGSFACALSAGGAIRCWGINPSGNLGDGTLLDRRRPVSVVGISTARGLQLGVVSTCAWTADEIGWCWGSNTSSKLGNGDATETPSSIPVRVAMPPYSELTQGWHHGAGLRPDGTVVQWGYLRGDSSVTLEPTAVPGMPPATHVEAGQDHTCALGRDGEVYCWGLGWYLGRPGGASLAALRVDFPCEPACGAGTECVDGSCVPVDPPPPPRDAGVAGARVASISRRCAVHASGDLSCWGTGYLGDGSAYSFDSAPPTIVPGIADAVDVVSFTSSVCALRADGRVWCWGANAHGELGDGTLTERRTPVRVLDLPPVAHIAGYQHAAGVVYAAAATDGGVWVWGFDAANHARAATASDLTRPVAVPGVTGARQIAFALGALCALDGGGTVRCWDGGAAPVRDLVTDVSLRALAGADFVLCALGDQLRCAGTVPSYGAVTLDAPIPGFAGARAVCLSFNGFTFIDALGDTYAGTSALRLEASVPTAGGCGYDCAITEVGEAWCAPTWSRARTL